MAGFVEDSPGSATGSYTPSAYGDFSKYSGTLSNVSFTSLETPTAVTSLDRSRRVGGPNNNGFASTITIGDIKDLGQQNSVYAYAEAAKTLDNPNSSATTLARDGVRLVVEGAKVELLQGAVKNAVQNIQGRARAVQGQ